LDLIHKSEYLSFELDGEAQARLSVLGDLIIGADLNVTAVRTPEDIETLHFLDSLSLLKLPGFRHAEDLADVGSGGGLPALVIAIAMPRAAVTAIESVRKKCDHIERCAGTLGLSNLRVCCERAEEHGRSERRGSYHLVVTRAVAALPVVAEYSLPLLCTGGRMVAMKGPISDQERTHALAALGILGADGMETVRLDPFPGCRDRLAYVATKHRETPSLYPRRAGVPQKRPLGRLNTERTGEARP
jgi:16S rRNA (guanine527-N7)-methyltransferase